LQTLIAGLFPPVQTSLFNSKVRADMTVMTKKVLIDNIAASTGLTIADCTRVVDQIAVLISEELSVNDQCPIPGIGKLIVKIRGERNGRNPKTGETIALPEMRVLSLRPGKHIKDILNRK
jgi:DNA-binding protein HU-beta